MTVIQRVEGEIKSVEHRVSSKRNKSGGYRVSGETLDSETLDP
jgi:hypothetical protein